MSAGRWLGWLTGERWRERAAARRYWANSSHRDRVYKWGLCGVCGRPNDPVHIWRDGKLIAIEEHEHPKRPRPTLPDPGRRAR